MFQSSIGTDSSGNPQPSILWIRCIEVTSLSLSHSLLNVNAGPRIPLSDGSSSGAASSSQDGVLSDGLPNFGINGHSDGSVLPESLPLPPPPPLPPNPAALNSGISLPPPPPPPPGPLPPKEQIANRTLLPPPPPLHQSAQPAPPGISGSERENNQSPFSDQPPSKDPTQVRYLVLFIV